MDGNQFAPSDAGTVDFETPDEKKARAEYVKSVIAEGTESTKELREGDPDPVFIEIGRRANDPDVKLGDEVAFESQQRADREAAEETQKAEVDKAGAAADKFRQRITEHAQHIGDDPGRVLGDPDLLFPEAAAKFCMASPAGAHLSFFLADHQDVAAALVGLPADEVRSRLDRIAADHFPSARKKITSAPDPIVPTQGRSDPQRSVERMSHEEYKAARMSGKIR